VSLGKDIAIPPSTTIYTDKLEKYSIISAAVDQQPITSMQDLQMMILQDNVNQKVTLSILRDGKSMDVSVTLAARPASVP
jgi:S1-C subfamily serine protease